MNCFFVLVVLVVRVMSAHDKGSHVEVEVKVKKVLYQKRQMKIQRGSITLYPESWTDQGCTCPILNPGQPQPVTMAYFYYSQSMLIFQLFSGILPTLCSVEDDFSECQHARITQ